MLILSLLLIPTLLILVLPIGLSLSGTLTWIRRALVTHIELYSVWQLDYCVVIAAEAVDFILTSVEHRTISLAVMQKLESYLIGLEYVCGML